MVSCLMDCSKFNSRWDVQFYILTIPLNLLYTSYPKIIRCQKHQFEKVCCEEHHFCSFWAGTLYGIEPTVALISIVNIYIGGDATVGGVNISSHRFPISKYPGVVHTLFRLLRAPEAYVCGVVNVTSVGIKPSHTSASTRLPMSISGAAWNR